MKHLQFLSDGVRLVGDLYFPPDFQAGKQYPLVVCVGSWTTVKEQMAGFYAQRLAAEGYLALAFDFRGYGSSDGTPRFYESPMMKTEDIKQAVLFAASLPEVDPGQVHLLGICAGAGYAVCAASELQGISRMALVVPWLHDAQAVRGFYGGEEGVAAKIAAARKAKQAFIHTGEVAYIPTISTTDPQAAMYGPYDYYLNPQRGGISQWSADKFAVMGWEDWLTFDPTRTAGKLEVPTLMVHSDGAVLPDNARKYYENIACQDKKRVWVDTDLASPMHQFSFYDQPKETALAIAEVADWFRQTS